MTRDPLSGVARGVWLASVGLRLLTIAIVLGLVGMCIGGGLAVMGFALGCLAAPFGGLNQNPPAQAANDTFRIAGFVTGTLAAVGGAMTVLGRWLCLAVPRDMPRGRFLAVFALLLGVVTYCSGMGLILHVAGGRFLTPEAELAMVWTLAGAWVLGDLVFVMFGAAVARGIDRDDLVGEARLVFWLWVVGVGFAVATEPVLWLFRLVNVELPRFVVYLTAILLGLTGVSRYQLLLKRLGPAIAQSARQRSPEHLADPEGDPVEGW